MNDDVNVAIERMRTSSGCQCAKDPEFRVLGHASWCSLRLVLAHIDGEPARQAAAVAAAREEQREACRARVKEWWYSDDGLLELDEHVAATPLTATPLADENAALRKDRDKMKSAAERWLRRTEKAEARVAELEEGTEYADGLLGYHTERAEKAEAEANERDRLVFDLRLRLKEEESAHEDACAERDALRAQVAAARAQSEKTISLAKSNHATEELRQMWDNFAAQAKDTLRAMDEAKP